MIQRQFVLDCVGPEIRYLWREDDEASFQPEMLRGTTRNCINEVYGSLENFYSLTLNTILYLHM